MKRYSLNVEKRTVLGKKVKKLRKDGILPANIYGKGVTSLAVQVPFKEFEKIFKEAGETGLIDVEVNGSLRPALIHNVQFDHITRTPLHADFYQVNLKEKVKTMVPIVIVGQAKSVTDKIGLLLQPLAEIEVEALPEDLPEKIEVHVEKLANVDEQITVGDIKVPAGVTVLTDPSQVVVKIGELVSKEAQEQAAAEAAKAESAAEGAEATSEGTEKPAEGEKPVTTESTEKTETQKGESKKEEKPAS